jgi:hypothetical protein
MHPHIYVILQVIPNPHPTLLYILVAHSRLREITEKLLEETGRRERRRDANQWNRKGKHDLENLDRS